jgi:glycosyltransferase involved in cell wall biosynthesis
VKKFQVLVSTYESRLYANNDQVKQLKQYPHLIIDQSPKHCEPEGLNVYQLEGKGLTKSRNKAIENAQASICLLSDDDLLYVDDLEKLITDSFAKNPDASVITFQVQTPSGKPYKNYKNKSFEHSKRSVISISSVEIAFKRDDIIDRKILLNENFGVNALFPCGEEAVFLNECMEKGLKVISVPIVICIHPIESSGKNFSQTGYLLAKGAMIRKLYGPFGFFLNFIYILKNLKKILISRCNITELFEGYFRGK